MHTDKGRSNMEKSEATGSTETRRTRSIPSIADSTWIGRLGWCPLARRPTRNARLAPSNKRVGPKKRKGLESEPLPAKPHFTPSQTNLGHHHPGKIKNHLACIGASTLPPIRNSYAKDQPVDSTRLSQCSLGDTYMNTLRIYNFSQYLTDTTTAFGRFQAPMAVRMAEARVSAQRVTSSARSASTMTRALGSVPE
jgi:hypothetical protein